MGLPVLIIDDDRVDRLTIRELLGKEFEVVEASAGSEAEAAIQDQSVRCILLDYFIPGTDTMQLLEHFAALGYPVVMLTGEGNEEVAVTALKSGAQDYLVKRGLNEDLLRRTVLNAIETVRLKQSLEEKQRELVKANRELSERVEDLKRMNSDLENFVHIASHDMREPLKLLHGYCDLLEEKLTESGDEEQTEYFEAIRRSSKRLANLLDHLRSLTRVTYAQEGEVEVDLESVLRNVLIDFEPRLRAREIAVTSGKLGTVRAYPELLEELLRNLIDNAIKYTGDPPRWLRIEMDEVEGRKQLKIENSSPAIPDEYLERVFEPFFRLPQHLALEGTGMGLALCRKIVERHGGRIVMENLPQGIQVRVRFAEGR